MADQSSFRGVFRTVFQVMLSGLLICAFGLLLPASTPAWGQDQAADWQASDISKLASNADVETSYVQASVNEDLSSKLNKVISLHVDGATLEQVLRRTVEKGDLKLVYGSHPVLSEKHVTLSLQQVTVQEALREVIQGTDLKSTLSPSGQLVLANQSAVTGSLKMRARGADFKVKPMKIQAAGEVPLRSKRQQGTITGTVTDSLSGEPIPGVNVVISGTQQGSSTDAEGRYTISGVEPGTYTLQASFVGYGTKTAEGVEVQEGQTTEVDFQLVESDVVLEDVVVTALGVERQERSLTYSAEGVDTERLAEARELNVMNSLTGKVAGLSINQAGTGVGSSSRVILRGNRSITGSSQPLYVVDGVPVQGDISDLSPDVIQDVNVLKGPNAAALYGSEAQNGAIVVTTKRGEAGRVNVSLNNNFTFRDPIILTEYQNQYGQGSEGVYNRTSTYSWGPRMEGQMVQHWSPNPELADTQIPYSPQPNNVKDQFQRGYNASTNLTASVGGETTQTFFSYTFSSAEGMVPNNSLQRHNVSARLNSQLTDNLALDSKLSYMREDIDYRLNTGESVFSPTQYMYRTPRNIRTEDMRNYEYIDENGNLRHNTWSPGATRGFNGYWAVNNIRDQVPSERITALASLTYDFADAVSLMVRGSYDGSNNTFERRIHNDTGTTYSGGLYSVSKSDAFGWNGDFLLSYAKDVAEDWYLDANFGGNVKQQRNNSQNSNTGDALTIPNFFTISNSQNPETSYNPGAPVDIFSLYSFAQIGWRDAIYLDVTGRVDRSSTLPADNRNYFYPSVGLSAIVSDLIPAFPEVFEFARVRASWANVGNSAPPFMVHRRANFIPGGKAGFLQLSNTLPAENLKPEETESYELGVDVRFFDGRLELDATAYQTNTRNQLFTVALPPGSGASSFFTNGGDVENRGIEMLLRTTPVQAPDFNWNLNFNFAANRNVVKKISDERPTLSLTGFSFLRQFIIEEGEPFGQVYSRGFVRDDEGRVIVDSDGMPQITSGQTVPVANFNPDWTGNISSTIFYKNISASFLIDHRQGGTVVSQTNSLLDADGLTKRTLQGREGGLVFGDNFFSDETAVLEDGSPNDIAIDAETFWRGVGGRNAPVGEPFVVDATNTRLRELTLGYTFSQDMLQNMNLPISSLRISLVGRNLFFIHRASENVDPDLMVGTGATAEGLESFAPPTARMFGANLRIEY